METEEAFLTEPVLFKLVFNRGEFGMLYYIVVNYNAK